MAGVLEEKSRSKRKPLRLPFDTTDLYDFDFANILPKKFAQKYTNIIPHVPQMSITGGSSKITRDRAPKVPPRMNSKEIGFLLPSANNLQYLYDSSINETREMLSKRRHRKRNDPLNDIETDSPELLSYPEPKMPPPPPRRQLPGDKLDSGPVESSNSPKVKSQHKINRNLKKEIVIKNDIRSEHEMKIKLSPERIIFYKSDDLDTNSNVDSKSSYNVSLTPEDLEPTASEDSLSRDKNARILNWMYLGQSVSQPIKTKSTRSSLIKQEVNSDEVPILLYNPGNLVTKSDIFEFSNDLLSSKSMVGIEDYPSSKDSRRKVHFSESILEIPPEKVISLTNNTKAKLGRSTWSQYFPEFETEKVITLTQDHDVNNKENASPSKSTTNIPNYKLPEKSAHQCKSNCILGKYDIETHSSDMLLSMTQGQIPNATFSSSPSETMQAGSKSEKLLALRNDITGKLVAILSRNSTASPEILQVAKELSENLISKLPENFTEHLILDGELPLSELESDPGHKISNSFRQNLPEMQPSELQQRKSETVILPTESTGEKQDDPAGIGIHLDTYLTKILKCSQCFEPETPTNVIQDVETVEAISSENDQSAEQIPTAIQNERLAKRMSSVDVKRSTTSSIRTSASSLAIGNKNFGLDSEISSDERGFMARQLPSGVTLNFKSIPQRSFVSVSRLRKQRDNEDPLASHKHRTVEIPIEPTQNGSQLSIESASGNSVASNDKSQPVLSPKASSTFSRSSSTDMKEQNLKTEVFQDLIARFGSTLVLSDVLGFSSKTDSVLELSNSGDTDEVSGSKFSIIAEKGSLLSNPSISVNSDDGSWYQSGSQSFTEVKAHKTQAPDSSTFSNTRVTRPHTTQEAMTESYQRLTDHLVDMLEKVQKKIDIMDDHLIKITKKPKKSLPRPKISKAPNNGTDNSEEKKTSKENQGPTQGISSENQKILKETPIQESPKQNTIIKSKKSVQGSLSTATKSKKISIGGVIITPVKSKKNIVKPSNPTTYEMASSPKGKANLRREPIIEPAPRNPTAQELPLPKGKANLRREPLTYPAPQNQRKFSQENIHPRVGGARLNSSSNRSPFLRGGTFNGTNSREYLGLSDRQIAEFLLNNFPLTTDTVAEMVSKPLFANDYEIRKAVQSELAALLETNPRVNPLLMRHPR